VPAGTWPGRRPRRDVGSPGVGRCGGSSGVPERQPGSCRGPEADADTAARRLRRSRFRVQFRCPFLRAWCARPPRLDSVGDFRPCRVPPELHPVSGDVSPSTVVRFPTDHAGVVSGDIEACGHGTPGGVPVVGGSAVDHSIVGRDPRARRNPTTRHAPPIDRRQRRGVMCQRVPYVVCPPLLFGSQRVSRRHPGGTQNSAIYRVDPFRSGRAQRTADPRSSRTATRAHQAWWPPETDGGRPSPGPPVVSRSSLTTPSTDPTGPSGVVTVSPRPEATYRRRRSRSGW
jgi:hypothetical protein